MRHIIFAVGGRMFGEHRMSRLLMNHPSRVFVSQIVFEFHRRHGPIGLYSRRDEQQDANEPVVIPSNPSFKQNGGLLHKTLFTHEETDGSHNGTHSA